MKENHQLTQEQYSSKLNHVADLGINYATTGNGWFSLRDAFNDLCESSGANKGINLEATIGRRKLLAQSVSIKAISCLSREADNRLQRTLDEIAEDYSPTRSRGMRR